MKTAGPLVALLFASALAGCSGQEPANPNLAAPKLVLSPRADGNLTVFVHSAFGERTYDWIVLRADNGTVANLTDVFSLEQRLPMEGTFLEVAAQTGATYYHVRARIDPDADQERMRIAILDDEGGWSDPRSVSLPYERIVERVEESA